MNPNGSSNTNGLLARLPEHDRERLGEALRRLVAHGSILGLEPVDVYGVDAHCRARPCDFVRRVYRPRAAIPMT